MAEKSAGTSLQIFDGVQGHDVGGITKIGSFTMASSEYETTTLNNSDGFRTFGQGMKDAGELSLDGFFNANDNDGQMALKTAFETGDLKQFAIVFPSSARFELEGFVKSWGIGAITPDGLQTFKSVIRLSGKPVFIEA